MNRFSRYLLSSIVALGITGCSEPETSIISVDQIKERIITAINTALGQKKDSESQSIAVRSDSNTCRIIIPDSPQENKVININCYGMSTSVTTLLSIKGSGTIENVEFGQGKFNTQSGCIVWNIHLENQEISKINTCNIKMSA